MPAPPGSPGAARPVTSPAIAAPAAANRPPGAIAPPYPQAEAASARPSSPAIAPPYPQTDASPAIAPPSPQADAPARAASPIIAPTGAPPSRSSAPAIAPAYPQAGGPPPRTVAPAIAPASSKPVTGASPAIAPVTLSPVAPPAAIAARVSPLPATGAVETVSDEQALQLALIADGLDHQDYFQVLQVPQTATAGEIKRSFYRDSRVYHPDRIFHLPDGKPKSDIGAIYRRITEAYYVLRDDAKRKKYLVDVTGPERATKLRYTEASEAELKAEAKKVVEEEFGTTPKGRQFFKTALQEIERQQWAAAERNLKSAIMYESSNAKFKEKLALVQAKLDDQRKVGGDSFKIK